MGSSCEQGPEYSILIEAFATSPDVLTPGANVRVDVEALETGEWSDPFAHALEAEDIVDGTIRIAVELSRPGQVLVHVVVSGMGGTWVATRCYSVTGVVRSKVMLSGPLDDVSDPDADGWAEVETCQARLSDDAGCDSRCPPPIGSDCDPTNPEWYPGAPDACGDLDDQDCDGELEDCQDQDGDGSLECPEGVSVDCDCDDQNDQVGPHATETAQTLDLCENGRDDDCDGTDPLCDRDGDGSAHCEDPEDRSGTCDCADDDPAINPSATETPDGVCDEIDNNCNRQVDEVETCLGDDLDLDGSPADCEGMPDCTTDCNDCAPSMVPDGTERCGDRIDGDCTHGGTPDGQPLPLGADACDPDDGDADGSIGTAAGGTDCDDADSRRYPGAPDLCGDGVDQNCSGTDTSCGSDGDGDGYAESEDCDDGDPTRAPWLDDPCNGRDDDCDGMLDEDTPVGWGCVRVGGVWQEVDFATNIVHCGECRRSCNAGCDGALCKADDCEAGVCTCDGRDACAGGSDDFCCPGAGCRNLDDDIDNCGQCGAACSAAVCLVAACVNGECDSTPAPDGTQCSLTSVCCGGACNGDCAPGDEETGPCGNCGTRTRVCDANCAWGVWSGCTGEGECIPGTTVNQACGNCGTQSRECGNNCRWPAWESCAGEGACSPGAVRQVTCNECGNQEQRCANDCSWADFANCDNNPARTCDDGDPCTRDSCNGSGNCDNPGCGGGTTCCVGVGCRECCGSDVSTCGNEPTCADWNCDAGSCVPDYESRGTDPEGECSGSHCCSGTGSCVNTQTNC